MKTTVSPARKGLRGRLRVPGDKSISHRAVLFAAMSNGSCRLTGVLDAADIRSTISAVESLGARVERHASGDHGLELVVTGWGSAGPLPPSKPVDCGNSGTTARLLAGVLAGWPIEVTLVGDTSLSRRPMRRVMKPLELMGATFAASEQDTLPMTVHGGELRAISYDLPVASAQVKSAILLAAVRAVGRTIVREPARSRDHTERLLPAFGVGVGRDPGECANWIDGPAQVMASDVAVPADPSSAAFMVGAALIVPGSDITLTDVSINPTRIGFLRVLQDMGADISIVPARARGVEPIGTLRVRYTPRLRAVTVAAHEVPSLIDEVPLLAVMATRAEGTSRFEGVGELRVKESDRLQAIVDGLTALGVTVRSEENSFEIDGPVRMRGGTLSSRGDHRLAMSWAVAALGAGAAVNIDGWEAVDVSYPGFAFDLGSLQPRG